MKIKTSEKYQAEIVSLSGDLRGGPEGEGFNDLIHKLIDEGKKNIVVDLGDVKFMNSTGIGMLIRGYTSIMNAGGKFVLANVTERIESLLVITQLIKIFDHYESVDEAAKSFK
jgi:anti-sigma B factor antagonist